LTCVLEVAVAARPVGTVGAEGVIVTVAGAVLVGSAFEAAMTVTVAVEGMLAGAEYTPLVDIVPTVALPPVAPFTCQVTPVLLAFVTVAENGLLAPIATLADVGATVTATVDGLAPVLLLPPPPPHAATIADRNSKPT
jgi:hypothetical protein